MHCCVQPLGRMRSIPQGTFTRTGADAATLAAMGAALSAAEPRGAADFQNPGEPRVEALVHQVLGPNLHACAHCASAFCLLTGCSMTTCTISRCSA